MADGSAQAYDVEAIRADFPILKREVYGKPLTYLDNAASAQKPKAVIEAVGKAYEMEYANVHRGLHFLSNLATANYEKARETVRRFLNAPSASQIIFTRNATEAINLVAQSFGGLVIGEGDEIVLSILEHHSNIVPWHFHRERRGAVIRWSPVDDDGNFLIEAFEALLGPRTRMVAITHMSNALGTISEVFLDGITYAEPPHRFEAGTPAIVQAIGLGVALDYMMTVGRDRIAAHEAGLLDHALRRLSAINNLRIIGQARHRGAIISFNMNGAHAHDIATVIDRAGVAVRAGTHCTMPLLARFGTTATCRASFAMYNTHEEVERLGEALESAGRLFI
jgi:selenocysteine lyase/cysteine desulfurase